MAQCSFRIRFRLSRSYLRAKENAQFRQGNKFTVVVITNLVCPLKLRRILQEFDPNSTTPDSFIFRRFHKESFYVDFKLLDGHEIHIKGFVMI